MRTAGRYGPYAKGVVRREEILRAALAAYGATNGQQPTLKAIAASLGMTEPGVLHYFANKDDLLLSVLAARDVALEEQLDLTTWEGLFAAVERTYRTPGEVKLFVDMQVAATDPDHPARTFMRERHARLLRRLEGLLGTDADGRRAARTLLATLEGLQLQWLRDPSVDIIGDLRELKDVLAPDAGDS